MNIIYIIINIFYLYGTNDKGNRSNNKLIIKIKTSIKIIIKKNEKNVNNT